MLAAVAALLSIGVLAALVVITRDQGSPTASWFIALLVAASAGLGYGTTNGPHRRAALLTASVLLLLLGILGLLTVGLPLLVAGALGVAAAGRVVLKGADAGGP